MTQPPTGGYPPPGYPQQPPAGPGGGLYGSQREPQGHEPTQQFGIDPTLSAQPPAGYPQSAPPATGYPQSAPPAVGYPQSAPPAAGYPQQPGYPGGYPQSAPPAETPASAAYGPTSGTPVPGQYTPTSGQPFGPPMSGPPGYPPPATTSGGGGGRGRAVLVLAIVAGLLFVLGGVMTGLYLNTSGDLERTEKNLVARTTDRDTKVKEIEKLKGELQTAKDKLTDTQQDLTGTKNDRDEQARQKKVIASCLEKLTTALAAAAANNKTAYDQAVKGLDAVCDEAEKYL
ncbi:hypothetical protein CA850_17625 [Micromonospora echinospora]|uniref:Uncharacterized protein n=1 Tax=Micromonospora echinospora TaxID=1877 RepID=A0A1C4UH97_MICEC|nr:hypothetical protein [Micromonospora echinospora]OZV79232.1 hypothetical protein CA850_17625 [Micromonospora echinospora]SCE71065.1 hypothetical protein GA0070618_0331 [Micromonospora echinospora]